MANEIIGSIVKLEEKYDKERDEMVIYATVFISRSGVMRGHGKTPSFMAGMKCLPHRHVLIMSAANNCMRPIQRYIY
jgi:hypothetical protein